MPTQDYNTLLAATIERPDRQADQAAAQANANNVTNNLREDVMGQLRDAGRATRLAEAVARYERREFNVGSNNRITFMRVSPAATDVP